MQITPLAVRLRPQLIQDVLGQSHVLGEGKPLRVALESQRPHSVIFWGPSGAGKTTISRLLADSFNAEFIALSATDAGVKDIRTAAESAYVNRVRLSKPTILFIDEIHRFSKSQQDTLLPFVEDGTLILIGATTENVSFHLNTALLSRCSLYILKELDAESLNIIINRACKFELDDLTITKPARLTLIRSADGDARRMLNNLEIAALAAKGAGVSAITEDLLQDSIGEALRQQDNKGDTFFNQISALHKSVRGSHPDAALYWFCRMLETGTDPRYLSRRIVRIAWEDIGLADPRAMQIANDAATTFERLGSPEGELALAQAVIYLACAPKSNAGYAAFNMVMSTIKKDASRPVPEHLRNAPTKVMKQLGYGKLYRYAHDEPGAYAAGETYLPEGMEDERYYFPVDRGLEKQIGERLDYLKNLDKESKSK